MTKLGVSVYDVFNSIRWKIVIYKKFVLLYMTR